MTHPSDDDAWQNTIRQRGGWSEQTAQQVTSGARCQAGKEGDCEWSACPQNRDGEPKKNGRWCPLDPINTEDED